MSLGRSYSPFQAACQCRLGRRRGALYRYRSGLLGDLGPTHPAPLWIAPYGHVAQPRGVLEACCVCQHAPGASWDPPSGAVRLSACQLLAPNPRRCTHSAACVTVVDAHATHPINPGQASCHMAAVTSIQPLIGHRIAGSPGTHYSRAAVILAPCRAHGGPWVVGTGARPCCSPPLCAARLHLHCTITTSDHQCCCESSAAGALHGRQVSVAGRLS
jgi:hypothetical protein